MEINGINTYDISYNKVDKVEPVEKTEPPTPVDKPDTKPTDIQRIADLNEIKIEKKVEETEVTEVTSDLKHSVEYNKELDQQVYLASKNHSIVYQFPTEELLRLREYLLNK